MYVSFILGRWVVRVVIFYDITGYRGRGKSDRVKYVLVFKVFIYGGYTAFSFFFFIGGKWFGRY